MTDPQNIFGDNQTSAVQATITHILELIDDPKGRKNTSNFLYQSDPRRKSTDFGSYPIVYIEDYSLETNSVNVGGNLFQKTLRIEFHVIANDDSAQQKQWHDQLADRLIYKFEYDKRQVLAENGIGQPEVIANQRFTGVDAADQPVVRREFEVEAPVQIDMERVGGADPYE